jgi:hypothetical protein
MAVSLSRRAGTEKGGKPAADVPSAELLVACCQVRLRVQFRVEEVVRGSRMPFYEWIWTDEAIEHLREHDVSPEDFEDVVSRPIGTGKSRSSGLPAAFGYTTDGRYIIAIYKMVDETTVLPVTAYEVEEPR